MTDRELLQDALDALTYVGDKDIYSDTIDALRTALTQPEPVAMKFQIYKQTPPRGRELEPIHSALLPWVYDQDPSSGNTASMWVTPVATLPSPQREWVGLTDEEVMSLLPGAVRLPPGWVDTVRAIEAKLKEKNND
jgi:hypothetical protein